MDLQYKAKFKMTSVAFFKEIVFFCASEFRGGGMQIKTCLSLLLSVIIFFKLYIRMKGGTDFSSGQAYFSLKDSWIVSYST